MANEQATAATAESIAREAVTHDSQCRADDVNGCDCGYARAVGRTVEAITEALATARRDALNEAADRSLTAFVEGHPVSIWLRAIAAEVPR